MENEELSQADQIRAFYNIAQPRIEGVGEVIINHNGEVDPTAIQTIRTNGVRIVDLSGPSTTASTFTVNFDNNWSARLASTDTTQFQWAIPNNYQSQITYLDSSRPVTPNTYTTYTTTDTNNVLTVIGGVPQWKQIEEKEEPYYNFLDNITLTRD